MPFAKTASSVTFCPNVTESGVPTKLPMEGFAGVAAGGTLVAHVTLKNTGTRSGKDVPQIYVGAKGFEAPKRLAAFQKVELQPGASTTLSLRIDPRLTSVYDSASASWKAVQGPLQLWLGSSAADLKTSLEVAQP